jgi:hypothetical protein
LLAAAQGEKALPVSARAVEEQCLLLWREYEIETSDIGRAMMIARHIDSGVAFSPEVKIAFLERISDEDVRDRVRGLLYQKKVLVPAFRWSRQPNTALVTVTCKCGNPSSRVCTQPFRGWCAKCYDATDKKKDVHGKVEDANIVLVFDDGSSQSWAGTTWVSRKID